MGIFVTFIVMTFISINVLSFILRNELQLQNKTSELQFINSSIEDLEKSLKRFTFSFIVQNLDFYLTIFRSHILEAEGQGVKSEQEKVRY